MADVADWETVIIGGNGVEIVGMSGKGLDRAEGLVLEDCVVHHTAPLTIIFIFYVETHTFCCFELLHQRCRVWEDCTIFEEADVLLPELGDDGGYCQRQDCVVEMRCDK